ncbi:MAG: cysteine--tRNA ligase [Chloroflexi bacterium]|nr:cysteine--tRNA ligase [Chloroflexota bacterium]
MKIYNTLTGQKEEFKPFGTPVKMYVCGVTPYDEAHIGHAMSYIVFDMITRYLEFRGYQVKHVQNFTDIDDKIIARAQERNVSARELAEGYIAEFFKDMDALNVKRADIYPRATEEMNKIVEVIGGLIAQDQAYVSDGDVYFRVTSDGDYGKLSHRSLDDMMAGARVEVDVRKEHPMDFALWKASKPGEPYWESPWGHGRPGWHIECSAMILKYLGDRIDIHGGGQDLIFPHHENEIAQSESFSNKKPFVKYWMHNGLLQLGGEKMSKSLGNLITIKEALSRYSSDALRLFVLSSHYRAPLTYTDEVVMAAERGAERMRAAVQGHEARKPMGDSSSPLVVAAKEARARFVEAMDDDFNTAAAVAALFDLVRDINRAKEQAVSADDLAEAQGVLLELAGVLGFTLEEVAVEEVAAAPFIELLIDVRRELRAVKQYALADQIRKRLADLGIALEDHPEGTTWKASKVKP